MEHVDGTYQPTTLISYSGNFGVTRLQQLEFQIIWFVVYLTIYTYSIQSLKVHIILSRLTLKLIYKCIIKGTVPRKSTWA